MERAVIYPGTFDPITYGHLDLIKRASHISKRIIVAVTTNPQKNPLFNAAERLEMVKEATKDISGVEVESFKGLVIDYARKKNVKVIVRGIRMISDFEYEFQMALTNRRLAQDIETVFLMPSEDYSYLSSTLLKEAAQLGADISAFVPEIVREKLKKRFRK